MNCLTMTREPILPNDDDRASPDDRRWQAVLARDRRSDGQFVFGVASTGVYCRPSCPARHAHIRHVSFYHDGKAARTAGLRACLRLQSR